MGDFVKPFFFTYIFDPMQMDPSFRDIRKRSTFPRDKSKANPKNLKADLKSTLNELNRQLSEFRKGDPWRMPDQPRNTPTDLGALLTKQKIKAPPGSPPRLTEESEPKPSSDTIEVPCLTTWAPIINDDDDLLSDYGLFWELSEHTDN